MKQIALLTCIIFNMHAMDNPAIQPTQEEYELFKMVKRLREIAHESREEIRHTMGFADERPIAQYEPNEHIGQTEKGIFIEMGDFPERALTPFGRVDIVEQTSHRSDYVASLAASQLFFKRVKASITEFYGLSRKFKEVLKPITHSTDFETATKEIPKGDLDSYIGTSSLLVRTKCGNDVVYRVTQVDSHKIPDAQMYDYTKKKRDPEVIAKLWKLMEERYEKERLGR